MKLLKKPVVIKVEEVQEEPKKRAKNSEGSLPPDTYQDEIDPIELVVDEARMLITSVKRGGELGLPCVDIRQFATTERFTGFTKKGINFPIELLPDIIEVLQQAYEQCCERDLFE